MARPKDGTIIISREGKPVKVVEREARARDYEASNTKAAELDRELKSIESSTHRISLPSVSELINIFESVFPIRQSVADGTLQERYSRAYPFIVDQLLQKVGGNKNIAPWKVGEALDEILSHPGRDSHGIPGDCSWYFDEYLVALLGHDNEALKEARAWINTKDRYWVEKKGGRPH